MKKEKSCGAVVYKIINNQLLFLVEYMKQKHISLPKGHIENNESEIATAYREIKEETSLNVKIDSDFRKVVTYSPKPNVIKDVVFFVALCLDNNNPVDNHDDEVVKSIFLPFDEAYELLTYNTDKEVLNDAYKYIKNKNFN